MWTRVGTCSLHTPCASIFPPTSVRHAGLAACGPAPTKPVAPAPLAATGTPLLIKALPGKAGQAEMTTDQGAIYTTDNAAYTWSAAVQETVDATLNRTVASGGCCCA